MLWKPWTLLLFATEKVILLGPVSFSKTNGILATELVENGAEGL